ncbi:hypothetical protein QBC35DRAFT_478890 [Podospora australis]|uniref:Uncharacterized protein n=1 Tax=Podospora australis TaxID=1536484 RepID=A0AAN6WJX8_9PEZI|nr:hypothetical protein QBC35DRAFT_478890 [Podospora australis]
MASSSSQNTSTTWQRALTHHLSLPSSTLSLPFITSAFAEYATNYLSSVANVSQMILDPDLAQISARVSLSLQHPSTPFASTPFASTPFAWTKNPGESETEWDQTDHAVRFVARVLDILPTRAASVVASKNTQQGGYTEVLKDIHTLLCILQSIWVDQDTWVEDEGVRGQLRGALIQAVGEVRG